MKTIYFIPTYWYHSIELFREFSSTLDNRYRKVFLDTGDPLFESTKMLDDRSQGFNQLFDFNFTLQFPEKSNLKLINLFKMIKYKNRLKEIFDKYSPDLIITTGDRNNFYLLIKQLCPNAPIVIVQQGLLHTNYY